jgi:hypothetical protein
VTFLIGCGAAVLALITGVAYLNIVAGRSPVGVSQVTMAAGASAGPSTEGARGAALALDGVWTSFEGKTVSLELPAWFVGGMPESFEARAALERLLGMDLDEYISLYFQSSVGLDEIELLVAGVLERGEDLILVTAVTDEITAGSSLEDYAEELRAWFAGGDASIKTLAGDRVYCHFGFRRADGESEAMVSRMVLIRSGALVHIISYTASVDVGATLDSIFEKSAGTIVERE